MRASSSAACGLLDARLRERELGDGLRVVALRGVELVLRDQVAPAQLAVALDGEALEPQVRARLLDLGARVREVRVGLAHLHLEGSRIDLRDELALADRRVEVDVDLPDRARDVGADLDLGDRLHGAGRGHGRGDLAAVDLLGDVAVAALLVAAARENEQRARERRPPPRLPAAGAHCCATSCPIARSSSATAVWKA